MKFVGFILRADSKAEIADPTMAQIEKALRSLRSEGPVSFASLQDDIGNFVQAAGGQVTCMIEKRSTSDEHVLRAFQEKKSAVFADGTILSFGGGSIALAADEWFVAKDAIELFEAFATRQPEPARFHWRRGVKLEEPS